MYLDAQSLRLINGHFMTISSHFRPFLKKLFADYIDINKIIFRWSIFRQLACLHVSLFKSYNIECKFMIQSNLAIRNFLVTLKLFLNAKSSLLQTLNQVLYKVYLMMNQEKMVIFLESILYY